MDIRRDSCDGLFTVSSLIPWKDRQKDVSYHEQSVMNSSI